jgi:GNAT superfamily N-acetyltransferase
MSSSERSPIRIAPTRDMDAARHLFREYVTHLGLDLAYQGFDAELAGLPGCYAEPAGTILLATSGATAVGCIALRPQQEAGYCEMKRLFVRPTWTGHGLGRRLIEAALAAARERGYRRVRLDTLTSMEAANALYHRLGFHQIEAYCFNPLPGALFYEFCLDAQDKP